MHMIPRSCVTRIQDDQNDQDASSTEQVYGRTSNEKRYSSSNTLEKKETRDKNMSDELARNGP